MDSVLAKFAYLFNTDTLDFAGDTVVHISAAIAGLAGASVIGKRSGDGRDAITRHTLTLTRMGASKFWCGWFGRFGWFGFNAGSVMESGAVAKIAFLIIFLVAEAALVA